LEVRRKWAIPEEAFCVLYCGKFIAKKRPFDLVEAARLLLIQNSSSKKLHLLFVGSGELGAELRRSCHVVFDAEFSNSQPSTVNHQLPAASFAGFLNQSELPSAYVAADCLVLPSDAGETWGLVVNEAMATDLPCIASDQCGCAEDMVRPLSDSGVFPMGNVAALAMAIENQLNHPVPHTTVKHLVADFALERTIVSVADKCLNPLSPTNAAN
jgi:glycosyltransferase involved in cell wall biosynthesis